MKGYKYNTEKEASISRKECADYYGLPKGNGSTLYWVDYQVAGLNVPIFWYIQFDESIKGILGKATEFDVVENEMI
jgi:hypothetical protein